MKNTSMIVKIKLITKRNMRYTYCQRVVDDEKERNAFVLASLQYLDGYCNSPKNKMLMLEAEDSIISITYIDAFYVEEVPSADNFPKHTSKAMPRHKPHTPETSTDYNDEQPTSNPWDVVPVGEDIYIEPFSLDY